MRTTNSGWASRTSAPPRTIHLIDLENEVGSAVPTPEEVRSVAAEYLRVANWRPGDLTILGSSRICWIHAAFDWPTSHRWVVRDGEDGADLALLAALSDEPLWSVGRVVIGSGDHLFAAAAARLAGEGLHVEVVCRPGALSTRLRLAAHRVSYLPRVENHWAA